MAAGDVALRLLVTGRSENAISALLAVGRAGSTMGSVLNMAGLVAGAGVALFGAASLKMGADFKQATNRLITGAGDVTDNMQKMGMGILGVSVDTGVLTSGTDGLSAAMYQVVSSGQRSAQALDTLGVAARGAQIEQANVVDVANSLSGAMTNYGTAQYSATQYMNGYISAVSHGKITLEDLAKTMGPLQPIARNVGISFADLAAAMTVQTNATIPASRAATGLRFLMQSLENPTLKANKAFAKFGLDSVAVGNELKTSLPGALEMIYNAAKRAGPEGSVPFNRAVADMIGGQRSLSTFMALTGTHFKDFVNDSKGITAAMNNGKGGVTGWALAQSNLNVQMGRAHAAVNALMIMLGTALLPAVTSVVAQFASFVSWLTQGSAGARAFGIAVASLVGSLIAFTVATNVIKAVNFAAMLIGWIPYLGTIIGLMWLYVAAATAAAIENIIAFWPVYLVILIIIVVIAIVILSIQHWGQIMAWLGGVFSWCGGVFSWLGGVAHVVVTAIGGWFSWLGATVHGIITAVKNTVGGWFSWLGTQAQAALHTVGGWFDWLGTFIHNFATGAIKAVQQFFDWLYNHNYYWKAMVDSATIALHGIGALFSWLGTQAQAALHTVGGWFDWLGTHVHEFITGVKNTVGGWFDWLGTRAHDGVTIVGGWFSWLGTQVNTIWTGLRSMVGGWFSWLGTQAHNGVATVGGWFSWLGTQVNTIWTGIRNGIGGFFSWLGTFVHDRLAAIGNALYQAGINFMNMLANGIINGTNAVIQAAMGVVNKIKSILGFHSPTEIGPGSTAHLWMPALLNMLSSGIIAGIPQIAAASLQVAKAIAAPLSGTSGAAIQGGSLTLGGNRSTIVVQVQGADINLDKRKVGDVLFTHQATELRRQRGIRNQ